ncbi:hypothetical protein PQJ75_06975 [Rhodoplanes sp. TEM]|uniref:Uncharacterized protein n=1 Tax=Rhodoplanes tepidamans TaxID=200616 RepID=A0ABT5J470_RHOTP|nr:MULTISPECIES: hypothetical protein [Rhodoplanes]MDC7784440.1 hypothetical protein [Rhodoplanes tepidamans]MDC7983470.1 hypothetical protein [Rhodoplanes sp. TEM]MDQ0356947.1 hypothetical protein [Rhodoplanes tepidamans]
MRYTPVLVEMIAAGVVIVATLVWHVGAGRRRDAERLAALRAARAAGPAPASSTPPAPPASAPPRARPSRHRF